MKYYLYRSPVVDFTIRPTNEGWDLFFKSNCFGHYSDPGAAADDVRSRAIGCSEWSIAKVEDIPHDLFGWLQVNA